MKQDDSLAYLAAVEDDVPMYKSVSEQFTCGCWL